ncbi:hypothetical protein [Aquipuribacter sp. SD81]|uniref:hypothetical protein n=1 Tax=Aquipuribacter sp. SD81 TaxID=3127703 RepID=UPI00301AEC02
MSGRGPGPGVLAGAAAVAGLLALGSLGLGWAEVVLDDPLGAAGDVRTTVLPGRQVAPVVAALVPAAVGLCVVALLLRGRWRLLGLVPAVVVALAGAAGSATALAGGGERSPTAGPVLGAVLCLVLAGLAAVAAWRAGRGGRSWGRGQGRGRMSSGPTEGGRDAVPADGSGTGQPATVEPATVEPTSSGTATAGTVAARPPAGRASADRGPARDPRADGSRERTMWDALDAGEDPTAEPRDTGGAPGR